MTAGDDEQKFSDATLFAKALIRSFLKAVLIAAALLSVAAGLARFMEPERTTQIFEGINSKIFLAYSLYVLSGCYLYGWAGAIRKVAFERAGELGALGAILFGLLLLVSLPGLEMVFSDDLPSGFFTLTTVFLVTLSAWFGIVSLSFMLQFFPRALW